VSDLPKEVSQLSGPKPIRLDGRFSANVVDIVCPGSDPNLEVRTGKKKSAEAWWKPSKGGSSIDAPMKAISVTLREGDVEMKWHSTNAKSAGALPFLRSCVLYAKDPDAATDSLPILALRQLNVLPEIAVQDRMAQGVSIKRTTKMRKGDAEQLQRAWSSAVSKLSEAPSDARFGLRIGRAWLEDASGKKVEILGSDDLKHSNDHSLCTFALPTTNATRKPGDLEVKVASKRDRGNDLLAIEMKPNLVELEQQLRAANNKCERIKKELADVEKELAGFPMRLKAAESAKVDDLKKEEESQKLQLKTLQEEQVASTAARDRCLDRANRAADFYHYGRICGSIFVYYKINGADVPVDWIRFGESPAEFERSKK
jgi:hypothetical protein